MLQLSPLNDFPANTWTKVICLNLVHRTGLDLDEVLNRLNRFGASYTLKYQRPPHRPCEFNLFAHFYTAPLEEIPLTEEEERGIHELLDRRSDECTLTIGTNRRGWLDLRELIERPTPPPPPKPSWYIDPEPLSQAILDRIAIAKGDSYR